MPHLFIETVHLLREVEFGCPWLSGFLLLVRKVLMRGWKVRYGGKGGRMELRSVLSELGG